MTIGGIGIGSNPYDAYTTGFGKRSEADKVQNSLDVDEQKKTGRKSSPEECETCKKRKYQDGSDEANVSFKNASHVSPQAAGAAVRAHEGQHVSNAYKKASEDKNAEVVSASVTIHTAVCPECGKTYVSGGETRTSIKHTQEPKQELPVQAGTKSAERGHENFTI